MEKTFHSREGTIQHVDRRRAGGGFSSIRRACGASTLAGVYCSGGAVGAPFVCRNLGATMARSAAVRAYFALKALMANRTRRRDTTAMAVQKRGAQGSSFLVMKFSPPASTDARVAETTAPTRSVNEMPFMFFIFYFSLAQFPKKEQRSQRRCVYVSQTDARDVRACFTEPRRVGVSALSSRPRSVVETVQVSPPPLER